MIDLPSHPSMAVAPAAIVIYLERLSMNDALSVSRPPPPEVPPVEIDGVRYKQDDFASREKGDQPGGYLAAIDAKTGKQLWRLKVYDIPDPGNANLPDFPLMFQSMKALPSGELEIENESGYRYHVDPAKRTTKLVSKPEAKTEPKLEAPPPPPKPK